MTAAPSTLEARGETAVLGVGPSALNDGASYAAPRKQTALGGGVSGSGSTFFLESSASGSGRGHGAAGGASSRSVGKRKQRRSENARLTSNPHATRPTARDYSLSHPNARIPTFPLPPHLSRLTATPGSPRPTVDTQANGRFNLRLSEASFFLNHQIGVRVDPRIELAPIDETLTPPQRCVRIAEAEIRTWMDQVVFRSPTRVVERVLFEDQGGEPLLKEETRHPHSLVWTIREPYMRLAIHCLARVLGCPSFSKDAPSSTRQTWILHPRPPKVPAGRANGASDIDTPPATDVGTDLGSEASDWAGLTEESELSEAEGYILADAVSDFGEDDTVQEGAVFGDQTIRDRDRGEVDGKALRALDDVQEVDSEADADVEDG